jgi:hypothetical protein
MQHLLTSSFHQLLLDIIEDCTALLDRTTDSGHTERLVGNVVVWPLCNLEKWE